MTSGVASVNHAFSSSLLIKPIFGKGREERLNKFQEIIKEANLDDRFLTKWMKKAQEFANYKCRLLYQDGNPIGVLIYHVAQSKKFKNALTIKLLHTNNLEQWNASHTARLFGELIKAARDKNLNCMTAKVSVLDSKTIRFLQHNKFRRSMEFSVGYHAVFYRDITSADQVTRSSSESRSNSSDLKRRRQDEEKKVSSDKENSPSDAKLQAVGEKKPRVLRRTQTYHSIILPSQNCDSDIST